MTEIQTWFISSAGDAVEELKCSYAGRRDIKWCEWSGKKRSAEPYKIKQIPIISPTCLLLGLSQK